MCKEKNCKCIVEPIIESIGLVSSVGLEKMRQEDWNLQCEGGNNGRALSVNENSG